MADLKTIISLTQEDMKRQVPVEEAVHHALGAMSSREAEVVTRRNGLSGQSSETLQEIGAAYGVTRERVRQIENQGLQKFRAQLQTKPLADLVALLSAALRNHGGIMSRDGLLGGFLPAAQNTPRGRYALAFLLDQLPEVGHAPARRYTHAFYARSQAHIRAAMQVIPALNILLEKRAAPATPAEMLSLLKDVPAAVGVTYLLDEAFIGASLEVGTAFVACGTDQWGLRNWPDINPRNIREKTLFVLKKADTPLHFKDITEQIRQAHFDTKNVTVQAVHNELINGGEFILIGRGIYALAEWGYLPGTVAEVITSILNEAGEPLDREEIITRVLKQRHVSRNTILINLQDRGLFIRTGKHSYTYAGNSRVMPAQASTRAARPAPSRADRATQR